MPLSKFNKNKIKLGCLRTLAKHLKNLQLTSKRLLLPTNLENSLQKSNNLEDSHSSFPLKAQDRVTLGIIFLGNGMKYWRKKYLPWLPLSINQELELFFHLEISYLLLLFKSFTACEQPPMTSPLKELFTLTSARPHIHTCMYWKAL